MKNQDLTIVSSGGGAVTETTKVPKSVQQGLTAIRIAFQAGKAMEGEDRAVWLRLGAKVIASFPLAVQEYVLELMLVKNPRNPFPPTPQDLYAHCEVVDKICKAFGVSSPNAVEFDDGTSLKNPGWTTLCVLCAMGESKIRQQNDAIAAEQYRIENEEREAKAKAKVAALQQKHLQQLMSDTCATEDQASKAISFWHTSYDTYAGDSLYFKVLDTLKNQLKPELSAGDRAAVLIKMGLRKASAA